MRLLRLLACVAVATPLLISRSAAASSATTLSCAQQVVSTWSVSRLANESIAVSVNAENIGAMGPAAKEGFAGLLLFGTTAPPAFARVVATLQRETPDHTVMLVMTDQEGGGVERLTNLVATLPWARTMGKNLTPFAITTMATRVGTSMMAAGVNTDLAPVLDVDGRSVEPGSRDPDGYRSFSGSPSIVARDGVAFMRGLSDAGVLAVVKHFPGLGSATGNTDDGPAATQPWSRLQTTGLVPFVAAIKAGAKAVMVSNARVPGLTPLPSTLSPAIYTYLRRTLGFGGLIVTDSLGAGALSSRGLAPPAASLQAITAGADLVLAGSPASPSASLRLAEDTSLALQSAVAHGVVPLSTLQRAAAYTYAALNTPNCVAPATG